MVQGMRFLSKKGFNPQNQSNRKQVWEAQQSSKQEKERIRKRQEQLKREQEEEELQRVTKGEIGSSQAQLRFMYDAPPGLNSKKDHENAIDEEQQLRIPTDSYSDITKSDTHSTSFDDLTKIQPGDDDAAAAFRRMLASSARQSERNTNMNGEFSENSNQQSVAEGGTNFTFAPVLQGMVDPAIIDPNNNTKSSKNNRPVDNRSALEKAVGRKDRSANLSYQQQIERFPQLKNAPMAPSMKKAAAAAAAAGSGGNGNDDENTGAAPMMVNFKPLGAQILHVRCLACGQWGHQKNDRECPKSGWNPFALPSKQKQTAASVTGLSSSLPPTEPSPNSILPPSKAQQSTIRSNSGKVSTSTLRRKERDDYSSDEEDTRRRKRRKHRRRDRHSRKRSRKRSDSSDDDDDDDDDDCGSILSGEDSHTLKYRKDRDSSSQDDTDRRKRHPSKRHHKKKNRKRNDDNHRRHTDHRKNSHSSDDSSSGSVHKRNYESSKDGRKLENRHDRAFIERNKDKDSTTYQSDLRQKRRHKSSRSRKEKRRKRESSSGQKSSENST